MTVSELKRRILHRVGDDPDVDPSLMHYTPSEVLTALNQCQRIFAFFTLCLETTGTLNITSTVARYALLSSFADWIAPLRIRAPIAFVSSGGDIPGHGEGGKLRPCRIRDLAALNESWSITPTIGSPDRYNISGFDLLSVYKQATTTLELTYARCPVVLIADSDSPEIPLRYHPALIDGAVPLLRVKEGMQEFEKTLPSWSRFMDAIQDCSAKVRSRNREQGYDTLPVELKRMDRSRVLQKAG